MSDFIKTLLSAWGNIAVGISCRYPPCQQRCGRQTLSTRRPLTIRSLISVQTTANKHRQNSTERRNDQISQNLLIGEFSSILASPHAHLITLSARASTLGGIVKPICFAALRLITNSNFVGCSTGRSAGLAPFRILST